MEREKEIVKPGKKFIGINEIEDRTKQKYLILDDLRLLHGFPMINERGTWTLQESDLLKWLAGQKIEDGTKITAERCALQQFADSGKVISGMQDIEHFMNMSYVSLLDWKSNFGFPLRHEKGSPVLKVADLTGWIRAHGGNLKDIDSESLQRDHQLEQIQNTEERELIGLQQIAEFTGRPESKILDWFKNYPNFPGKRGNGAFVVGSKQLLLWMHEAGEPRHPGGSYR